MSEKRPDTKLPAAVTLGRRGGLKGGKKRMAGMTPGERAETGRKGAAARWGKRDSVVCGEGDVVVSGVPADEVAPPAAPRVAAERVLCAAIWVDTGVAEPPRRSYAYPATGLLFCAWRHGDCLTALQAWADRLAPEERARVGQDQLDGRHQGFLTSRGRFVYREEAMSLARAAGQVGDLKRNSLYSEDLY